MCERLACQKLQSRFRRDSTGQWPGFFLGGGGEREENICSFKEPTSFASRAKLNLNKV